MSHLAWNRYGKASVRLVRVHRDGDPHRLHDLTVKIQLEGNFDAVYREGDNATCVATDTMKNTVYALARQGEITHVEAFADRLASLFAEQPQVSKARVSIVEQPWQRIACGGQHHPHAFIQAGAEHWTARVTRGPRGASVSAGIDNLVVLKTTDSSFAGFPRDRYTTLPETDERILATAVRARWRYAAGDVDYGVRERVREAMLETFAAHNSRSVQHTLYAMADAALGASAEMRAITLRMPNRHHLLADLSPFGLDNPNEVFIATDQPYGLIEARIKRSRA